MLLYETTMQIVPLLLITLFLDSASIEDPSPSNWTLRWNRLQDRVFALLGIFAFITSLFIVAEVADASRVTAAIVISTLSLAISLLFARIWRRLDEQSHPDPGT